MLSPIVYLKGNSWWQTDQTISSRQGANEICSFVFVNKFSRAPHKSRWIIKFPNLVHFSYILMKIAILCSDPVN